jgi:DNA-binding NarL/FixJ family response regulator
MAYGPESIRRYYDSAYYNEYAAANGARETIAASFAVGDSHGSGWASLHFWNDRAPQPPRFQERDVAILRLLFPAFRAGVETHLRYGAVRSRLHSLIDRLEVAAMICDAKGRVLHQTPALTLLLDSDPEGPSLRAQLEHLAFSQSGVECCRTVATASARYRISAAWQAAPRDAATLLRLITIERLTARPRTDEELRNEFALTRAECRVSRLLAAGMNNADIATELSISPSTARRHTEQVLKKLAARSRAEVAAKLAR